VIFCSREAQAHQGVHPGTGPRGAAYVFLPVRKQLWGDKELNGDWASPEEVQAIQIARRAGVVTRLYNPSPPPDAAGAKILVHRADPSLASEALEAVLGRFSQRWGLDYAGAPRLAICTHGTRDRCCAKWGFAVYREALRLFEAGASVFEPMECSHLGGDRYAATGIFFPSGSMYGHLDGLDLEALCAAETAQTLVPGHYRGRVFESELTQVVRAGLARDGISTHATAPIRVLNPEAAPGEVRVALDADGRSWVVSLAMEETRFYGSCAAAERGKLSRRRSLVYAGARPLDG
jgi:hypothetical protein